MPTLLSRPRRAFSLLSLLAAAAGGASLSASCTLDLAGQGTGGSGGSSTTTGMGGSVMVCTPLTEKAHCYTGAVGTEGKGACKGGQMTCNPEGTAFGPCLDQVIPTEAVDDCKNGVDTTCDGTVMCPCNPNETKDCYDGMPASTKDKGICKGGTHTCNAQGTGFGECMGQVKPAALDDCATQMDENCDGMVNEAMSGCVCDPTMTVAFDCMTGLPGVCDSGTQLCAADGKGYGTCIAKPIFQDCFTPTAKDCYGVLTAACMGTSIVAGAPGASPGDDVVFGVASDTMGNIFLGGVSGSSKGSEYAVISGAAEITKLDKSGMQIWKKNYPATGVGSYSVVRGVSVDGSGNIFLIGEYQGVINSNDVTLTSTTLSPDVFVIKLDSKGIRQWSKSFGGIGDQVGASISASANGSVFITGTMAGMMDFGSATLSNVGIPDVFVAKLDASTGDAQWSKNFGDSDYQYGWHVAATGGNVAITGQFLGEIDFGGGKLQSKGKKDIFLAKLDGTNGSQVWSKAFGDNADQVGYGIAVDNQGNIALTGTVQGKTDFGGGEVDVGNGNPADIFVASFAPDGAHRWSKFFGDTKNSQTGRDLVVDAAGNILVTGYFNGSFDVGGKTLSSQTTNGGTSNVFVAKLKASDGSPGWAYSFGDVNEQVSWSVTADPLGNVIFGGTFKGMIDFGPPAGPFMTTMNNFDAFWAKLAP